MLSFLRASAAISLCVAVGLCATGCGSTVRPQPDSPPGTDPVARVASDITRRPIDGGPTYFSARSPRSSWMDQHILIGAWLEQPMDLTEVRYDRAMGENMYWNLAGRPGDGRADYNVIRAGGMHVSAPDATAESGSETVAYDGTDESDMNYGPGWAGFYHPPGRDYWNSDDCVPSGSKCGYTATRFYYDGDRTGVDPRQVSPGYPTDSGLPVHQGFGKGVLFWESDQQAAQFLRYSDILSADVYWLTDDDASAADQGGCALLPKDPVACGGGAGTGLTAAQTHLPANYAFNVTELERLQAINGPSKPIVVDVETGCPGSGGQCATPPQTTAAAWHALIAGARGIIWFQHNFSGPCIDDRTFIDGSNPSSPMYRCQQTPGVTLHDLVVAIGGFDRQVAALNDVLLSPTVEGYARTTGVVDKTVKAYGGDCYIFAGSGQPGVPPPDDQTVTIRVADRFTGKVTVFDEGRTLQAHDGVFSDVFADANAVHIYRLDGSDCR